MAATVEELGYNWFCDECDAEGDAYDWEDDAKEAAAEHNAEHHGRDDD